MENSLQKKSDEVEKEGAAFLDKITMHETKLLALPLLISLLKKSDDKEVIGFQQMIRKNTRENYMPFYTTTRISRKFNCTISQTIPFPGLEINRVNPEMEFLSSLKGFRQFQTLTKKEKEILKLIYLGETSKMIAGLLNVSYHTIRTHRKNIHKKLEIKRLNELIRVAGKFFDD